MPGDRCFPPSLPLLPTLPHGPIIDIIMFENLKEVCLQFLKTSKVKKYKLFFFYLIGFVFIMSLSQRGSRNKQLIFLVCVVSCLTATIMDGQVLKIITLLVVRNQLAQK